MRDGLRVESSRMLVDVLWSESHLHFSMKRSGVAAAFILLVALTQKPCDAQSTSPPLQPQLIPRSHEEREQRYQNLHRLFLNVQLSGASSQQISGLTENEFTILHDHRTKKIKYFGMVQGNSSGSRDRVILVLDAVNNSSGKFKHFRDEVERYLKNGDAVLTHSTSIAFFSDSGMKIGAPSTDRATLIQELSELAGNVHGLTCAEVTSARECGMQIARNDTFSRSCDVNARLSCLNRLFNSSIAALTGLAQEQSDGAGRVIVIWIGEGWPFLDQPGFAPDTSEVKAAFYRNLVTISSALAQAQMTLDVVGSTAEMPIRAEHVRESVLYRGAHDEDEVNAASLSLQALAYQSGGLVLTSGKGVAAQIKQCIADLDLYYSLAIDYEPASQPGRYHALEIKVDKPDITARTRTLYYAEQ